MPRNWTKRSTSLLFSKDHMTHQKFEIFCLCKYAHFSQNWIKIEILDCPSFKYIYRLDEYNNLVCMEPPFNEYQNVTLVHNDDITCSLSIRFPILFKFSQVGEWRRKQTNSKWENTQNYERYVFYIWPCFWEDTTRIDLDRSFVCTFPIQSCMRWRNINPAFT